MVRWRSITKLGTATCTGLVLVLGAASGIAQQFSGTALSPGVVVVSSRPPAALVNTQPYKEPEFVGSYCSDGKFKAPSRLHPSPSATSVSESGHNRLGLPEVPPWIDLHNPSETVIEDYAPPARAKQAAHGKSRTASLAESIVSFAYGREVVLRAPTHLTTDSRQHLIISDPLAPAVQMLDGKRSLRIAGGPQRRLERPNGVAVDGHDNIYVTDSKSGLVEVYDPQGRFLRHIGYSKGERMFQEPTGIAIDRNNGRLYVLDSPAGELIVLDLDGNVIQRAGGKRRRAGVDFDFPTEIAVGDFTLVVLDSSGSRLQVFDLQCHLLNGFAIRARGGPPTVIRMGLALDHAGNIYVSSEGWSAIRVYKQDGRLVGAFGRSGQLNKDFNAPTGLWIDAADRIYVADTNNHRVQVFQAAPTIPTR